MKQFTRRAEILSHIARSGDCKVTDLARELDVSAETIRRDLRLLEKEGAVSKFHGSVGPANDIVEGPFQVRMKENAEAKDLIGRSAASHIKENSTIFIDGGTTSFCVFRHIPADMKINVVTNSLVVAARMGARRAQKLFLCGGALDFEHQAFYGATALAYLDEFAPDLAIISIGAINTVHGLMNYHVGEAELARHAVRNAKQVMCVADHTKFDRQALAKVAEISRVNILVTNQKLKVTYKDMLDHANVVY